MKHITMPKNRPYVEVRIHRHGYRTNKAFGFKKYGTREAALEAAHEWLKEQLVIANELAPLPEPVERKQRKPRKIGNDSWQNMSDEPKPRPTSQILLWSRG